jgi:DNA (cytosine-5)-methyltransferase 1
MKYIELFAGIGGFRSGLDQLDFQCLLSSEINKYASTSYKILYGENDLHGDITKINEKDIPDHDLLVGGFPCQAFSIAGKRKGFEDARGTLFFEIARILKEKKPKLFLLENVPGLLSHDKGKTFEVMCQIVSEIGYAIDFKILNSMDYGIPQNRNRIFIIGTTEKEENWHIPSNDVVSRTKKKLQELNIKTFNFEFPKKQEKTKILEDILEENPDEKYYLSKDKMIELIYKDFKEEYENKEEIKSIPVKEATKIGYKVAKEGDTVNLAFPTSEFRRGRVGHGVANTLETSCNQGTLNNSKLRKLTPLECFRLQGFTDEQFYKLKSNGLSDAQLYKQAGNAVTVNVIKEIGEEIIKQFYEEV